MRVVLSVTAGLGAIVYVPSAWLAFSNDMMAIFIVDTVAIAGVLALWWFDRLPMVLRAAATCFIFYGVGVGLLFTVGPVSQIYLLGASVFTTLLLGPRWRIATTTLNIVTIAVAFALTGGGIQMKAGGFAEARASWAVVVANFAFINVALVLAVGKVLDTLEREQTAVQENRALLAIAGRTALLGGWRYVIATNEYRWTDELLDVLEVPKDSAPTADQLRSYYEDESRVLIRAAMDRCTSDGTPFDLHVKAVTARGNARRLRVIGVAERDERGAVREVHGSVQDETAQKEAEARQQRLEQQLHQSQKLEAVGTLAGGVAHDFNNLLTVILSYSSLMLEERPQDQANRDDIEEIRSAAHRGAQLTRQLLAFGRKQLLQPEEVDLDAAMQDLRKLLARLLREDIQLTVLRTNEPCHVLVDKGQFEQVVVNLVVNARDAMPQGGKLTIELSQVEADEAYVAAHPGSCIGSYGMLTVTDTGVGMTRETQARIFEPFFTTKALGQGTGLGLASVYGIVQQSRGHIWLYSEPGNGTSFRVLFPCVQRNGARPLAARKTPLPTLRGTETLLVVEDEAQVREVLCSSLRRLGYTVLEAQNGGEALMVSEQFNATIHLLVTDVVMPMMSGRQVSERLRQSRADMRVLYTSGYTENTITHHGVLDSGVAFMAKPFTPDVLARRVREVLDAAKVTSAS
ncbi:MAG: hybrid sensor histidine kinase/response regulator [Archangium gephyra]|uniref:histidine kinase n=1 Tax=Archangium gephyra TaxID=48 RepID=A0A2W5T7F0_9BACT|nr:MAG: hybrid sensor histidine kinase/response regulator [Archangium gephyra]